MDRNDYTDDSYTQPHIPPGTPPVIDPNADAGDAARRAMDNGDSDSPGSKLGSFPRKAEDEELQPGGLGDRIDPQSPDEVVPDEGDSVEPGAVPDEVAPTAPPETELPPG